jgi:hypothetical protein
MWFSKEHNMQFSSMKHAIVTIYAGDETNMIVT